LPVFSKSYFSPDGSFSILKPGPGTLLGSPAATWLDASVRSIRKDSPVRDVIIISPLGYVAEAFIMPRSSLSRTGPDHVASRICLHASAQPARRIGLPDLVVNDSGDREAVGK